MRPQALGAGLLAPSPRSARPFELYRPSSLAEATQLLNAHPDVVIAAGCTDLVAQLREGRAPQRLMSVRRLPELQQISHEAGVLRIGGGTTHHRGSTDPVLRSALPSLAAAWSTIATVRIRYAGTLGGNLLARRYRYELPLMLGALRAELELGEDVRPVEWLWETGDPWQTHGLMSAAVVKTRDLVFFGYERSMRPLTTVALAVRRREAGYDLDAVVGSEYHAPLHVGVRDIATTSDPDVPQRLAGQLPDDVGDVTGSADYRRHVVAVLIRRMLGEGVDHE